ncbi:MAG: ATP-dependent DNA helicase RecG [candidate division Zixibacteria bacterium]|nr:ATP-dependent DNA helicase RecG [candidate division Zixibacteria bacterium]
MVINNKTRHSLSDDVQFVKGVGPKRAAVLNNYEIYTVRDLLYYAPRKYLDRTLLTPIEALKPLTEVTVLAEVESFGIKYGRGGRRIFMVYVTDDTASLELIWFKNIKYLEGLFKEGDILYISGKTSKLAFPQIAHPEFEFLSDGEEPVHSMGIIPMYPTSAELRKFYLDSRGFRKIEKAALEKYSEVIEDELSDRIIKEVGLISLKEALNFIHFPKSEEQLKSASKRLAFSELFFIEILMALRKRKAKISRLGINFRKPGKLVKALGTSLPFKLTGAQRKALTEIYDDMTSPNTMRRLLQGDVGSGKTVVAVLACALAIENNYKAAIMVPTEVLAEQHYFNLRKMFKTVDIEVILLTGGIKEKSEIYNRLKQEEPCLVIGTHALIQDKVRINKLGLAIIDEQHRFGVKQRIDLVSENETADLLVMTATPIPRTLAMTLYGDFDYSAIDEFPPGRKPVQTLIASDGSERQVYDEIVRTAKEGHQVYVVYPLVELSEKQDLQAAVDAYEKLKKDHINKYGIGLLHGRMSTSEKEEMLTRFNSGEIKILLATTVIEVGIDNPDAALMVIVGAERFGLSQLHQLRGRVGRGNTESRCILKLTGNLTDSGKQRIEAMETTNDGFRIAEFDLQIRGPGEFFGTRQHGFPEFKFADITKDLRILDLARRLAFELVDSDPRLEQNENKPVRDYLLKYYAESFKLAEAG